MADVCIPCPPCSPVTSRPVCLCSTGVLFFFFFQAEDGIRDDLVTGVQTCALPISLYHLVFEEDRRQAVRQAADRLRSGGLLFSTHLSRLGILGDLMRRMPEWIERGQEVRFLLDRGRPPDDLPRGGLRGYFARGSEIRPLSEALGIHTVVLAGGEPAISADDE